MLFNHYLAGVLALAAFTSSAHAQVERVWLTHRSNEPSSIIVNWETSVPAKKIVSYGTSAKYDEWTLGKGLATWHKSLMNIPDKDVVWHYSLGDGKLASPDATFKGYPSKELRVAVVGDWGFAIGKDLSALKKDDVHLIITVGDNVPSLHEKGKEGMKAFAALIDSEPELFRSTPFMPILGNHDKEIRPRGPKPPPEPVYDISAAAYREFFALPDDGWKWHFDFPDFDVRFIATDIQHISDIGTTWQSCHAIDAESEQFVWFRDLMDKSTQGFVFSLMNEKQSSLAGATKGIWHEQFRKGSALVTGFGYFAERAELDGGLPCFNTCLKGDGTPYKDAKAKFFKSEDNYLLLTFKKGAPSMTVQFKSLKGEVMDTRVIEKRKR